MTLVNYEAVGELWVLWTGAFADVLFKLFVNEWNKV